MRKNRFLALQKMAEQKKQEALMNMNVMAMGNNTMHGGQLPDGGVDHHGIPKQTVGEKSELV